MNPQEESVSVLVERLIASRDAREKLDIATSLRSRSPEGWRDIQMLNRAIDYFKKKHPEVYDRAKDSTLRVVRSIPPSPKGGEITYFRLEEACAKLVDARQTWQAALRERKAGFHDARRLLGKEGPSRGLREMGAIGRKREKLPREKPAHGRKPKRRLHS